ncbi:enoyl-CoA hydratase [Pseudohalioglobus sediminis]|uniref:Enoyl-CoA hydratase n=1 Tax=Pseudohalioglobus sediminis TaxID=2606449 RepID=A0A5B0X4B1_9GAMM|nr:enoyl-CoA hydratase [Pseudohalioglobus sediminis]KAA1193111.1 enoyl-CoA hydratase [Pseudohalioglobus sediminis]
MLGPEKSLADGELLLSRGEGVALLKLNRPQQFNALTRTCLDGLRDAMLHLAEDNAVHAIVLTGTGRAFSAGVDLKVLSGDGSLMSDGVSLGPNAPLLQAFNDCPKPIIAAVNGVAVTGGFELALACDFIYAAESARFADTHARVGLLPGWGLSQKLPRLVGINRAREISFTGNYYSAEEGLQWGLVNRVLPDDALLGAALETAREIATCLPEPLYRIKQVMNKGWETSLAHGLDVEGDAARAYNSAVDMTAMAERLSQLKARSKRK